MNDNTEPPCKACDAHDELENELFNIKEDNSKEHGDILTNIEVMAANINWMNVIGKWILVTLLAYFVALGYFVFSNDWVQQDQLNVVIKSIKEGEVLHYANEKTITKMDAKVSVILQYHIKHGKVIE